MANKIVEIMQYNGSTSDNLIPQKAQQADNATNATNAQNAVIGQYASSDTTKGTISQRLSSAESSLQKITSSFNITAFTYTPSQYTLNYLIRQADLIIGGVSIFNTSQFQISKSGYLTIGTVSSPFIPEGTTSDISKALFAIEGRCDEYPISGYIDAEGNVKISLQVVSSQTPSSTFVSSISFNYGFTVQGYR